MRGAPKPDDRHAPVAVLDGEHLATLKDMLAPAELDRLLERGEDQLAAVAAALQAAWARRDTAETRREAHKLAGLAGTIGCSTLLTLARDIETSDAAPGIPALLGRLEQLLPETIHALRRWRTALGTQP